MIIRRTKNVLPSFASARIAVMMVLHWVVVIALVFAFTARAGTPVPTNESVVGVQSEVGANLSLSSEFISPKP